ncbi:hypothetical protein FBU30_001867 [Linnemannia zychae]|nr:hypothetical protein FBU30_001867 [Linnemannia zychae]
MVKEGPFLSPILQDGVLKPTWSQGRSERQQSIDWIVAQQYWLLIRQNPGLRHLVIKRIPQWMGSLAKESFFYETISLLDRLVDITMDDFEVDLDLLLVSQPKLLCFRTYLNLQHLYSLSTTPSHLRRIECRGFMSPVKLVNMLARLPGLEEIYLYSFTRENSKANPYMMDKLQKELQTALSDCPGPSHLQSFILGTAKWKTDYLYLETLLPWWPQLRKLSVTGLVRNVAQVAVKHCLLLEQVGENTDPPSIFPSYYNNSSHNNNDSTNHTVQRDFYTNVATMFLKSCPHLTVLDGIKLKIDLAHDPNAAFGWVCPQLRVLRCQIIGLPQLTRLERMALETGYFDIMSKDPSLDLAAEDTSALTSATTTTMTALEVRVAESKEKIQTFQRLHYLIYDQLSQMAQLRRLVLGAEFRDFYRLFSSPPQGSTTEPRWSYDDPIPGTLEHSLASGLDRLATLTELERAWVRGV